MVFASWLRSLKARFAPQRSHRGRPAARNGRPYLRPRVEPLEDRALPSTTNLVVNGSFEDPPATYRYVPGGMTTVTGWETVLTGVEQFDPQRQYGWGPAQDGSLCLDLNTDSGVGGGIQQAIPTTVGVTY